MKGKIRLRDFGYSTKLSSKSRKYALRRAMQYFSEEDIIDHLLKLSKHNKCMKEDLKTLPLYHEQIQFVEEITKIENCYFASKTFMEEENSRPNSRASNMSCCDEHENNECFDSIF